MSNKTFAGIIVLLIGGMAGYIFISNRSNPDTPRPGVAQADKGSKHVEASKAAKSSTDPSTSGDHDTRPLPWQTYEQEVPDANTIHNLEHGGIYVTYRPDLPLSQVSAIKALFFQPFSKEKFTPSKVIVAPRATNSAPIVMSSWNRNMKLQVFDEAKMVEYYQRNVGKSPEPGAN